MLVLPPLSKLLTKAHRKSRNHKAQPIQDFTYCILVDSFTVICLMSPFVILGVPCQFCRFHSIFDGKSCTERNYISQTKFVFKTYVFEDKLV